MAYPNTPQVSATYLDGSLKSTIFSSQPKILVVSDASSGRTDEIFEVANAGDAEAEFGSDTNLCKGMHEVIAQGADHVALMRVGGKQGNVVITDSTAGTLTITPLYRDDDILDRYSLVMTQESSANRILVYDLEDQQWVYDTLEVLAINEGIVDVDDSSFDLFTTGDITIPDSGITLTDLLSGDFTQVGSSTISTVVQTAGADGTGVSLVEKYAALNRAYHSLDFKDADYVLPKGVYIDDQNIADGDTCNFFKGVPVAGNPNDTLGYVWQMEYQGAMYTYFVDQPDYFTEAKAAATKTLNTNLIFTAAKTGTGGNSISVAINTGGAAGPTVVVTEPAWNTLLITVTDDGTSANSAVVAPANAALAAFTMSNGKKANTIVTCVSGGATLLSVGGTIAATPLLGGTGGHKLTHADLTGDSIPTAVSDAFAAAETDNLDTQLREVNFAHQLASFCYTASTTWKDMLGAISVKEPTSFGRSDIASWVGTAPTLTTIGTDIAIDAAADNGLGLFAMKLMGGHAESSNGYRAALVETGNSTDGYAYGGLIKTQGLALPNADADLAYGIDDSDEETDANGKPIDIGKHIFVTVDWPIHANAFDSGALYRGSIEGSLLGLLATMPVNQEPIGRLYPLRKIRSVPRIHASQRDSLSKFRFVNLRFEEGIGWVFNSVKTAAHPLDSDFTRCSTIRCVNRILSGIRSIGKGYIGKPFDGYRLTSMQAEIDAYLLSQRTAGFTQGAVAVISYTRADKILGKLTVRVRMVPPFTIQTIDAVISLAADESEL
jgi:hypothetical protein